MIMLKYGYNAKLRYPWVCVYLKLFFFFFFFFFFFVAIGTKDAVSMGFFLCFFFFFFFFLYRSMSVCRMKDSRADWFAVYIFHILQKTGSYLNA